MKTPKPNDNDLTVAFWRIVAAVCLICFLWPFLAIFASSLIPNHALNTSSAFGDLFGGVNALFTALAFAAVWWSGAMQRKELELQRIELQLQRDELAQTRGVFQRQMFEDTFFQQLRLYREILEGINETEYKKWKTFLLVTFAENEGERRITPESYRAYVAEKYTKQIYTGSQAKLGSYFRTLYHIFKLVERQQNLSWNEKITYTNLARAQLGADDLLLLAANCTTIMGSEFKPLVEKYGLLKHLPRDTRLRKIRTIYAPSAFMGEEERKSLGISGE